MKNNGYQLTIELDPTLETQEIWVMVDENENNARLMTPTEIEEFERNPQKMAEYNKIFEIHT